MLHNILKCIIRTQRKHKFVFLNQHPDVEENCIYAVNHSCKWDCQYMMELGRGRCYILAGKQRLLLLDRVVLHLNGAVWVDRKDKSSKAASKEKMQKILKKGHCLCVFPEGTWNLRPSLPVLPLYWGIVDVAKSVGVPIVPMCFEYKGKECFVKYGEAFYVKEDEEKEKVINRLRDTFATLKWEIWEGFSVEHRQDIPKEYWEEEIARRLREYRKLDYEYEMSCVREGR